jgi:D-alanyl-D-alanine carboxypeptidase (penicillin-binding protein 5/6)
MHRILFLPLILALAILISPSVVWAKSGLTNHTAAKQAILIDHKTGMVLFEKNADTRMHPSSMSKSMTIYMVFEALREQRISLDDTFKVSEKAWRKGGSKMWVEVGKRVKIEDLIRGVIVQSGNDATIVLAEGLAGSEDSFAEILNARAKEIGLTNSNFINASGWPDKRHYSTARDLATLAIRLIEDYPEYYHYFSETEFTFNNIKQPNRNPLLYRDIGVDGLKTGHTEDGGYGLVASGEHNGRRVVLVVNGLEDNKARAAESAKLMEWGLKGFQNVNLFKAGEMVERADIIMGDKEQLTLTVAEDITVTIPRVVHNDLKVQAVFDAPLIAPIEKGQHVGVLKISVPRVKEFSVPLLAAENVEHLGLISSTFAKAKILLGGKAK